MDSLFHTSHILQLLGSWGSHRMCREVLHLGTLLVCQLACCHQIAVDLSGRETKEEIVVKIKAAVVKKRSIFLYRKDFHELSQSRGEDPERFSVRIKQVAPACRFTADVAHRNTVPTLSRPYSFPT